MRGRIARQLGTIAIAAISLIGCSENLGGKSDANSSTSAVALPPVAAAFSVLPSSITVQSGQSQRFSGVGGVPPYQYTVTTCTGTIGLQSGLFQSGSANEVCPVTVTDATGAIATATITTTTTSVGATPVWTDTSSACYLTAFLPSCSATPPSSMTVCETNFPGFAAGAACTGNASTYCISAVAGGTPTVGGLGASYEVFVCQ